MPPEEQAHLLARLGEAEPELATELRQLLAADEQDDGLPEALARAASQALGDEAGPAGGLRLGAWRVGPLIAHGGMGAVYHAHRDDGQYEQHAALKLLNPGWVSPAAQDRLAQERQILARLSHAGIARLLDGGRTDDGLPWLAMEYVDGQPIDRWCDDHGLDTTARLKLFVQVCEAVDYAHRNLVVHRDLKPSNILVDTEGKPRLLDFGIAKMVESADAGLTRSGERLLTPSHAAPEQIAGGAIGMATDVYALGVLLYDLLTGRAPHAGTATTPAALARAIVETDPPRPSAAVLTPRPVDGHTTPGQKHAPRSSASMAAQPTSHQPPGGDRDTGTSARQLAQLQRRGDALTPERLSRQLKGDLDNIVMMALRKDPQRRYPDARALADDIERHLAHLPVMARPDAWPYRAGKFLQRHPVAVPVSALAVVAALAGTAAFTWRLADERDRALSAESAALLAEASARRAEAEATRSAKDAREAADFSASLLENTGANAGAARTVSVQDLMKQASARVTDELADSPLVAAKLRVGLARALHSWGQLDDSAAELAHVLTFTETVEAAEPAAGADSALQAERLSLRGQALVVLSHVQHDQGHMAQALASARRAVGLFQRAGQPEREAQALIDVAIGVAAQDGPEAAIAVYRQVLERLNAAYPEGHLDTAWTLNNLGWTLHQLGRLDEAAPLYEQAVAMQRKLGSAAVEIAQTLVNRAGVAWDSGDLATAKAGWTESLQLVESVFGADGPSTAIARGNHLLALVERTRGNLDLAARMERKSLDMISGLLGPEHRYARFNRSALAAVLLDAGRLDEAEALLKTNLAAEQAQGPRLRSNGSADGGDILAGLARVAWARGHLARAEQLFDQALAVYRQPDSNPRSSLGRMAILAGQLKAERGRRAEGLQLAQQGLAHMRSWRPASHWAHAWSEAVISLPPFVEQASPEVLAKARAALQTVQQAIGPDGPDTRSLQALIDAAASPR